MWSNTDNILCLGWVLNPCPLDYQADALTIEPTEATCEIKTEIPFPFSGPAFWGLINPEWSLCNKGRRQSPVNLEPSKLLYDPNLRPVHIDKIRINGGLTNTGHSVVFTVDNTTRYHINITGGPLSYKYQFHEMHIHYGLQDDVGSEHVINDYVFPAEVSQ
ncbi:hypothetical protein WDU94_009679 [Cyamophila willieti]